MSQLYWKDKADTQILSRDMQVELPALVTVDVPGMCYAVLLHDCELMAHGDTVLMFGKPDVFLNLNLIVSVGPVPDGQLKTVVFNLSNHTVKIRKGQSVSLLLVV